MTWANQISEGQTKLKSFINWGGFIKKSWDQLEGKQFIRCPYHKVVEDFPTFGLMEKWECQSTCYGEGCMYLKECWEIDNLPIKEETVE